MNKIICVFTFIALFCTTSQVAAKDSLQPEVLISAHILKSSDSISVYTLSIDDIDGNPVNLSQFQGKKILFVNIATNSNYVSQLSGLEQLYQKYKDNLVVIAIPSNTFGNESRDDADIRDFVNSNYHIHYILASKMNVAGNSQSPLYSWLTQIQQNNMMSNMVAGDFFKFLVDGSGSLVGAFVSSVDPMGEDIQSAISN